MMEKKYIVTVAWGSRSFSANCEDAHDAWNNFHVGMKHADDVFLWEDGKITVHYHKAANTLSLIQANRRVVNHLDAYEGSFYKYCKLSKLYERLTGKAVYKASEEVRNYIHR